MRPIVSDMGCALEAAGQTRIYWNGPFTIQLEPAAEIGISFTWGNRCGRQERGAGTRSSERGLFIPLAYPFAPVDVSGVSRE
jgi:hypothetical protein